MDFLILELALLLDSGIALQAVEPRALDGLNGLSAFLNVFRGFIKGELAELDLELLRDFDAGVLGQHVNGLNAW